jgi:type I restriction enzyme, R subunit
VAIMRRDLRLDWTRRGDVQAKLRDEAKRQLRKDTYPPDKQEGAVKLVLNQMEALALDALRGDA